MSTSPFRPLWPSLPSQPFGSFNPPPLSPLPQPLPYEPSVLPTRPRVFVVHGRNLGLLAEVARFVEKGGFEAIILKEQSATGQTIIDEFIRYTNNVRFAVVLANADDEGRLLGSEELHPRARQNVVFELGYMIGKLGRHKVAVLADETIEYPSDYSGVIYIPLKGSDDWRILLSRALKKAIPTFNSKRALGL